ncbi:MAG: L-threonylcarbamoyladenylate synthase [Staphylococcus sp.]|nr:L-threonylcarbamoyladenylate synthase [Anaeroplasma bactoclasticum]MCM1196076.1 L-threonylcarbamoyladenylate synthase [Roseburia sp.]MCM1261054.1 L-threonylcarbamoyladenylate synthase [Staphylococcus sp.]MCM1557869.1 L-threonylcarbamoyladenylate synthase [Anaeroplasma bactoclasticum]
MSKLIIFPTDTVYGIGCPIFDIKNIHKIYDIKHRSLEKPLACLCYDLAQIEEIAEVDEKVKRIIRAFMPGALTLILKAKPIVTAKIGYKTIGVRIPDSKLALELLKKNGPMLTTSVNESGEAPLSSYEEIVQAFGNFVDQVYSATQKFSNVSSTVIDCTKDSLRLLREGTIPLNQINEIWNV